MMLRSTRPLLQRQAPDRQRCLLSSPNFLTNGKKPSNKTCQCRPESTCCSNGRGSSRPSTATASTTILKGAGAHDVSLLRRAGAWYSAKLTSHPLTTKAVTSGLIAAGGDLLCQVGAASRDQSIETTPCSWWEWWTKEWDLHRTARFGLIGSVFVAPVAHYWYAYLHNYHAGTSAWMISKRVVLDQFVCTPPYMVVWLSSLWTLEGSVPPSQLPSAVGKAMPNVMTACWALWVPMQYLNFYAVPLKYQVLFTNVVELAWNAYLSFVATAGGHGHGHGSHGNHGPTQQVT